MSSSVLEFARSPAEAAAGEDDLAYAKPFAGRSGTRPGLIRSPRGFTSRPVVLDDGSGDTELVAKEGTLLFRWQHERVARARGDERRGRSCVFSVRSGENPSNPLEPSFLPSCLPFVSALYGAPVAPACTDRHQMAAEDSARPRATPLRPRSPRRRYPVRITLAG